MKQDRARLTVTRKLILINLVVVGLALLATSLAYLWFESSYHRQNLSHAIVSQAKLIAFNSLAPLTFHDRDTATETLSALNSVREVLSADLLDSDQERFARYRSDSAESDAGDSFMVDGKLVWPAGEPDAIYRESILHVRQPIVFENDVIGSVYIRTSLLPFKEQQNQRALVVFVIYLIAFVVAAFAFSRLQRAITWPIRLLSKVVSRVASSNDYSLRVYHHSSDEIGALARGFNEMLNQIQKRDERLSEYGERLSREVARQTAELRASNEELARTVEALQEANETIREKERSRMLAESREKAKAEFLAHMSHELRTPMNGVLGMLSLLRETGTDAEQANYVDVATESATHLLALLDDILDYSKIEAGHHVYDSMNFDVQEAVDEVLELLGEHASAKGIEIAVLQQTAIPDFLIGDPVRVKQLVTNLVGNAIKFTAAGKIEIDLAVSSETAHQINLVIEVRDTGIGIPLSAQETIFEAFAQADSSTTRRYGGTGLGLALCKRIVEDLGGSISVRSQEQQGSCFALNLPFGKSSQRRVMGELDFAVAGHEAWVMTSSQLTWQSLCQRLLRMQISATQFSMFAVMKDRLENATNLPRFVFVDASQASLSELAAVSQLCQQRISSLILFGSHGQRLACAEAVPNAFQGFLVIPFRRKALTSLISRLLGLSPPPVQEGQDFIRLLRRDLEQKRFRLLVVEDNLVNQKVAKGRLLKLGHDVVLADNGLQAVQLLEQEQFDLVFMDCQMPVMDGYEAAQAIRHRNLADRTPIIAMTAHAMPGDRQRCMDSGMDDYLAKPVTQEVFIGVLHHWLISRRYKSPVQTR